MLTYSDYIAALRTGGLSEGDVAFVQSALWMVGPVEGGDSDASVLEFYLRGLQEVLGPSGTVAVFTLFTDYGRFGTPFIVEETPSQAGVFSEYVRTRPGALRSCHPIASVAALGPHAEHICGGAHYTGYGWDSPWRRLHEMNVNLVAIGMGTGHGSTSILHYIEQMYGVPYQYTKIYTHPVYKGGRRLDGLFTMPVRFLDFRITYDSIHLREKMVAEGAATLQRLGKGRIFCTKAGHLFEYAVAALRDDRYAFLAEEPRFRPGEIPVDGPTGPYRRRYDKGEAVA